MMTNENQPMTVATLCGSTRSVSANAGALRTARDYLRKRGLACIESLGVADIPSLDPKLNDDLPAPCQQFVDELERAAAIIIACPEYAGGMAGCLKNALDWCVGSSMAFYEKPIIVMSAGASGGSHAIRQTVQTLIRQSAYPVGTLSIPAAQPKCDADGNLIHDETIRDIEELTQTLVDFLSASQKARFDRLLEVAASLGIHEFPRKPASA